MESGQDPLLEWIKHNEILGIPADLWAHFMIGAAIGWAAYLFFGSDKKAYYWVWGLACVKELFFDITANLHRGNFFEPTKDIFISIIGGTLVLQTLHWVFKKATHISKDPRKRRFISHR